MDPQITSALIGFVGVALGLVARDLVIAVWFARQKRGQELQDRQNIANQTRRDLVHIYLDPLLESAKSLDFRLAEIINSGSADFLLAETPKSQFVEYKRISTLYRLAGLLGWIRAFRRERNYIDPMSSLPPTPEEQAIIEIEKALADGQHVERQRLTELLKTWKISDAQVDKDQQTRLATEIDAARLAFLKIKDCLSASDLNSTEKFELAKKCAEIIKNRIDADIPESLITSSAEEASLILGIKEAYLYRDWQSALGDMMIKENSLGSRRFDVIGYKEFEDRYLNAQENGKGDKRWFDRMEALFHNLEISKLGLFDARREQLKKLQASNKALIGALEKLASSLKVSAVC